MTTTALDLSVPVLDLREAANPATRPAFVTRLLAAAHDVGFLQLVGHGVGEQQIEELQDLTRRFFALPLAERLAIENVRSPHFRGYTRVGEEHTGGRPDAREQLDIGPEKAAVPADAGLPAYTRLEGPNQWPAGLPELRPAVLAWMDALSAVALELLTALEEGLGVAAGALTGDFGDGHSYLKLVRYPPGEPDGQGVGAHKDYGWLALLLQDGVGGLEVQPTGTDTWIAVPPIPRALVVNLGEMLELATSGYLVATPHRVRSSASERFSIPYFPGPRLDTRVRPIQLPDALAADAHGVTRDPANPLHDLCGDNALKGWLRAHPEVARRHHPDLLTPPTDEKERS